MSAGPLDIQAHLARLSRVERVERVGRVAEAFGTLVRASGLQAAIGETCRLQDDRTGLDLLAEVVGVSQQHTLLTPLGPLEGLSPTTRVTATGGRADVPVGEGLLGRVLDAHGQPIDGRGPVDCSHRVPVYRQAPNPLQRQSIQAPFATGVRAIDGALTVGEGQRVGIFAMAGGGKSTLLGMLARGASAEVNVIVLVGERGREVNEFLHDNLDAEAMARSVMVVATSDRPPLERSRAAYVGTAIAEHFRDRGRRVLLMVDSVTRFARALRDVGLAIGEPPARRGYPPSVFSELPRLFERAGNASAGSMTAFYTVLVEDEDGQDPVAEEVRSILDGHIVLSRKLAAASHFPAIDVLASASRVMPRVTDPGHLAAAAVLRRRLAKYQDIELLLQLGEYQSGSDAEADAAIGSIDGLRRFLRQGPDEATAFADTDRRLREATA
ncbi:MAG: FliI/YscN family ATPase [Lysobacteraceae bacterium]